MVEILHEFQWVEPSSSRPYPSTQRIKVAKNYGVNGDKGGLHFRRGGVPFFYLKTPMVHGGGLGGNPLKLDIDTDVRTYVCEVSRPLNPVLVEPTYRPGRGTTLWSGLDLSGVVVTRPRWERGHESTDDRSRDHPGLTDDRAPMSTVCNRDSMKYKDGNCLLGGRLVTLVMTPSTDGRQGRYPHVPSRQVERSPRIVSGSPFSDTALHLDTQKTH